jgi:hypothetical protein
VGGGCRSRGAPRLREHRPAAARKGHPGFPRSVPIFDGRAASCDRAFTDRAFTLVHVGLGERGVEHASGNGALGRNPPSNRTGVHQEATGPGSVYVASMTSTAGVPR